VKKLYQSCSAHLQPACALMHPFCTCTIQLLLDCPCFAKHLGNLRKLRSGNHLPHVHLDHLVVFLFNSLVPLGLVLCLNCCFVVHGMQLQIVFKTISQSCTYTGQFSSPLIIIIIIFFFFKKQRIIVHWCQSCDGCGIKFLPVLFW